MNELRGTNSALGLIAVQGSSSRHGSLHARHAGRFARLTVRRADFARLRESFVLGQTEVRPVHAAHKLHAG